MRQNRVRFISLLLLTLISIGWTYAQTLVTGRVLDKEQKTPIVGASVTTGQGATLRGTTTDVDGNFKLEVPRNATLTIRSVGYVSYTHKLSATTRTHSLGAIYLAEDAVSLGQVEVIASIVPKDRKVPVPELDNKLVVTSIGNEGTEVRIATNYMIEENTAEVEDAINEKLYNACKDFYQSPVTKDTFLSESIVSSQKVSASMSKDISRKAFIAVLISLIFMALYILLRFRRISYSIGAFASVTATTLSIIALYILLWKLMPFTMEIDQNFIAAILAIIGYSINDTVVVFDRIRETVKTYPNRDLYTTINDALNSTLSRTLNTSLTTFIVMFIIFIFGGASMRSFTFAILLGVVIGTYSTLFVASPIAYMLATKKSKKQVAKK